MRWSDEQSEIFQWFRAGTGNLVVRARAGTGKTTTIKQGVEIAADAKVLLAAFNQRTAQDLQGAISKMTRSGVEAKTLHSLGYQYVRYQWKGCRIEKDRDLMLAAEVAGQDAPADMVTMVRDLAAKAKAVAPLAKRARELVDVAERFRLEPEQEDEKRGYGMRWLCLAAFDAMVLAAERNDGTINFDDMLYVPVRNGWVRPWFDMVVVDEAQDMSAVQLILAQRACRKSGRIVVVGDDRQAIYSWRGADTGSIDRLKSELRAQELKLTTTYRCGRLIVERARVLVPDYNAAPGCHDGAVVPFHVSKLVDEAQPGDFILSRKNAPLVGVCLALLRAGKPAKVAGRDVAASLMRLVRRIAEKENALTSHVLAKLEQWKVKQLARVEGAKNQEAREQEILDDVATIAALAEGTRTIAEIGARIEDIFSDDVGQAILCSSVHKAKGLETDRVFVLSATLIKGHGEEQNIEYVAVTRAKHVLYEVEGKPEFSSEAPDVDEEEPQEKAPKKRRKRKAAAGALAA